MVWTSSMGDPRYPHRINRHHRHLCNDFHAIQRDRYSVCLFRALRHLCHIIQFPLRTVPGQSVGCMGFSRRCQCYSLLTVPVSSSSEMRLIQSASYLLILTYDRSVAAVDHITICHFTIGLISPVPSISELKCKASLICSTSPARVR
jgi:hypothetical protein